MSRRLAASLTAFTLVVLAGLGGSCATAEYGKSAQQDVVLSVENRNWNDAVIYSVRGGVNTRLGGVTSIKTATFNIKYTNLSFGAMQLYIRFIGSPDVFLTPQVAVMPGQHVRLVIEHYLPLTTIIPQGGS